jgi:hypothetical protein
MAGPIIDLMEYSSDASAQAAYVADVVQFSLVDRTAGTVISNAGGRGSEAWDGVTDEAYASSAYHTLTTTFYMGKDWGEGVTKKIVGFKAYGASDGGFAIFGTPANPEITVTLQGSTDNFNTSIVDLGSVGPTTDANSLLMQKMSGIETSTAYRYHRLKVDVGSETTNANIYIAEVQFYEDIQAILQSYSEDTIKTQGDYSLKGVAAITDSLDKTLTRTLATPLDLSGINTLKFDIRAGRTGSNIKVGLHDDSGITSEITPTVAEVDTWQTVCWDISAVDNANKAAIDSIIITIENADAENIFYIDNFIVSEIILLSPYEEITILEDVSFNLFNLTIDLSIYDSISIAEDITLTLSLINLSIDDSILLVENESAALDELNATNYEILSISEDVNLSLSVLYAEVYDLLAISGDVNLSLSVLYAEVYDLLAIVENVSLSLDLFNIAVNDSAVISEVVTNYITSSYAVFLFKDKDNLPIEETEQIILTWIGKSSVAPGISPVTMQGYNYSTQEWDNLTSNNVAGANVDFTLSATISSSPENYISPDGWTAIRIFQSVGVLSTNYWTAEFTSAVVNLSVYENISVDENALAYLIELFISAFEVPIVLEVPIIVLTSLNASIYDDIVTLEQPNCSLTELNLSVIDLSNIIEYISTILDVLYPSVYDLIQLTEIFNHQLDSYNIAAIELISIQENILNNLTILNLSEYQGLVVDENISTNLDVLNFIKFDSITLTEEKSIGLDSLNGLFIDSISLDEVLSFEFDSYNLEALDNISCVEVVNIIPEINISTEDDLEILEWILFGGIGFNEIDVYENNPINEFISIGLDELFLNLYEEISCEENLSIGLDALNILNVTTIVILENAEFYLPSSFDVYDAINFSEYLEFSFTSFNIGVYDSSAIEEYLLPLLSVFVQDVFDEILTSEYFTTLMGMAMLGIDSVSIYEEIDLFDIFGIISNDLITVIENVDAGSFIEKIIIENIAIEEYNGISPTIDLFPSESISFLDILSVYLPILISVNSDMIVLEEAETELLFWELFPRLFLVSPRKRIWEASGRARVFEVIPRKRIFTRTKESYSKLEEEAMI